jgi:hypothetical protein
MYNGVIPVNMTGHRLPTSYRCNRCSEKAGRAVWHDTHRGLNFKPCPFEESPPAKTPAIIERHKLGTFGTKRPKQHIHLNLADIMPATIPESD